MCVHCRFWQNLWYVSRVRKSFQLFNAVALRCIHYTCAGFSSAKHISQVDIYISVLTRLRDFDGSRTHRTQTFKIIRIVKWCSHAWAPFFGFKDQICLLVSSPCSFRHASRAIRSLITCLYNTKLFLPSNYLEKN